ncbi:MAG: hypothetical protein U1F65_05120 [Verrucomicrobiota bacterium]
MADADKTLELLIKTVADTAGIQLTEDQFEKLKVSVGKATEGLKDGTQEVEKHTISHRALHKAIHAVTEENPLLGLALQAALNPANALIAVILAGFHKLKQEIEELNEEMDKLGAEAAQPIGNMREALLEAKNDVLELTRSLGEWQQRQDDIFTKVKAAADFEIAKLREQEAATKRIAAAKLELAKATVEASTTMTEEQKKSAIAELNLHSASLMASADKKTNAQEMANLKRVALAAETELFNKQWELAKATKQQTDPAYQAHVRDREKQLDQAKTEFGDAQSAIGTKAEADQQKKRDDLDAKIAKQRRWLEIDSDIVDKPGAEKILKSLESERALLGKPASERRAEAEKRITELQPQVSADQAAKRTFEGLKSDVPRLNEGWQQARNLVDLFSIKSSAAERADDMNQRAQQLRSLTGRVESNGSNKDRFISDALHWLTTHAETSQTNWEDVVGQIGRRLDSIEARQRTINARLTNMINHGT